MKKNLKSYILHLTYKKGFTLVELLLVMAVLGVLATALITLINPLAQFQRTRDSQRKNDLAQLRRALEQYYNDFNSYPANSTDSNYYILDATHAWGTPWTPYMDLIPKDPVTTQKYRFVSTGQSYMIYAHLERGINDSQVCNGGAVCSGVPAGVTCGGAADVCNYGVSSSNASP
jgi:prepilin-type N-terminal cleavage/methylation domain-containing protein